MTAIGLRMQADDHGRESTTPWLVKSAIWPGNPEITEALIEDHLLLLDEAGYITIYCADGRTYYAVNDWPAVSHPAPSKHPPPPATFQRHSSGSLENFSAWEREGGESEGGAERPAGILPSPFCKLHQPSGTRANCRHCGTARLAHEQAVEERRALAEDTQQTDLGEP